MAVRQETYAHRFVAETIRILEQIDVGDVEATVEVLRAAKRAGGRLFFCGSGGGAGHASHAACDFRKLAGFEAYSVTDNVSELTARVNDDGWDTAYVEWLRCSRLRAGDALFVFSVGGGDVERAVSVNLVNAMRYAKEVGAAVVGIVGRDGGVLRRLADASILVPVVHAGDVTAQTEGLQALFWHLLVTDPSLCSATPKWESIAP